MRGNFPLPDGSTVRVESSQRYVVIEWRDGDWKVTTRRAKRDAALAFWRAVMREQGADDVAPHVIDTVNQEVLR